jgi:hypothetical protein
MITLDTVRSFPMFSPMRRALPETAAMQGPRVRFGDLRHPQLFDSQKSEPQGGAALTIENRRADTLRPGINFKLEQGNLRPQSLVRIAWAVRRRLLAVYPQEPENDRRS